MGFLNADPAAIKQFSDNMHKKHDDLEGKIRQVDAASDATTATWQGSARGAFDSVMDQYFQLARNLNQQLMDTADKVSQAGSKYVATTEDHASAIQNVGSSINL